MVFNKKTFYLLVCNQTLTGFQGVIESPNFPDTDPDITECLWTIAAPSGNSINISFSHFDIVNNPIFQYFFQNKTKSCSESYLEVNYININLLYNDSSMETK
jgi:hypothetical protein